MKYAIGQQVRYVPGWRGYFSATVLDYDYGAASHYIIEFSSGLRLSAWEDELEAL
ncbi:adhesin [uncultured Desulfovibrio sp.]|uniref:adhesin n=1 Tax=uncultured Desulfovibrio sp. TaxID=167968 RepID=UPI0026DDA1CB|nr:adhesin [uncultured Desulfovibrio sp.]